MSANTITAKGAVACGHPLTAAAAQAILQTGGNAVDAVIAALLAACVAEPVLASLGGGGFMLTRRPDGDTRVFDFFAQTPKTAKPLADFYPIDADFGPASQSFHIGLGAAAVPGLPAGIEAIHRWGASMPLAQLAEPACEAARDGVIVNEFQGYVFDIVRPIFEATLASRERYGREVAATGRRLRQPELAESIELIAREGADAFYRGEPGRRLVELCRTHGGHLTSEDLSSYRVQVRRPLIFSYRGNRIATNPAPSAGGELIRFALAALEHKPLAPGGWGGATHLSQLCDAMQATNAVRTTLLTQPQLAAELLAPQVTRGTTHISIVDGNGFLAAMTVSNGEGCGHLIPGTGIMLNNMLGEEDINPEGLGQWPCATRMGSMMAPTLLQLGDAEFVLGSGGSNRIRSAILQVLVNLVDFGMTADEAINAARMHLESALLSAEPGISAAVLATVAKTEKLADLHPWESNNLFFGGVHLAGRINGQFVATGDSRRGGVGLIVS